jgi:hypothetical protein
VHLNVTATKPITPNVFGNSIPVASFAEPATELRIESSLDLETYVVDRPLFQITPEAVCYPFIYSADDRIDLGRMSTDHSLSVIPAAIAGVSLWVLNPDP